MQVVTNLFQLAKVVWISILASLANVTAPRNHVKHVGNDAARQEHVSAAVKVDPPWIRRPFGKDLEPPRARMVPPNRGIHIDGRLGILRIAWRTHLGMRKDAMTAVKPTVGAPGEGVEQLVRIL